MRRQTYRSLAEARIREAQQRGDLDGLEGEGKPLRADTLAGLPADARMVARVAGCVGSPPPEIELARRVRDLQATVDEGTATDAERTELREASIRLSILHERSGRHLLAGSLTFVPG